MNFRTCPNCQYKYSFAETFKLGFKQYWSFVYCKKCNSSLEQEFRYISAAFVLGLILLFFILAYVDASQFQSFIIISITIICMTTWFTTFKLKTKAIEEVDKPR